MWSVHGYSSIKCKYSEYTYIIERDARARNAAAAQCDATISSDSTAVTKCGNVAALDDSTVCDGVMQRSSPSGHLVQIPSWITGDRNKMYSVTMS